MLGQPLLGWAVAAFAANPVCFEKLGWRPHRVELWMNVTIQAQRILVGFLRGFKMPHHVERAGLEEHLISLRVLVTSRQSGVFVASGSRSSLPAMTSRGG